MLAVGLTIDALLIVVLYTLLRRMVLGPVRELDRFAAAPTLNGAPAHRARYRGELKRLRESLLAMIERLQTGKQQLRMIGDNLPDSMLYQVVRESDGSMRFLHVSAGVRRLHGLDPEAVLANPSLLYDQFVDEDRSKVHEAEVASATLRQLFSVVVRIRHADGSLRWMDIRSQPRVLADGRILWDGVETDITAQKQAETERDRLGRVVDAHDDCVCWIDGGNRITYANPAACRSLGYGREELIGKAFESIAPGVSQGGMEQLWSRLRRDGRIHEECLLRHRGGREFPAEVSTTLVRIDGEDFACAFARDISERKAAENRLKEQLDELRRWHGITLDRENRICQLKAEVNSLTRRMGEPPPYPSQIDADTTAANGTPS
jgi:PAS domain S-box-containing protein